MEAMGEITVDASFVIETNESISTRSWINSDCGLQVPYNNNVTLNINVTAGMYLNG